LLTLYEGYTAIEGKKMFMEPGDMIITPQWQWHDHGNDGDENVIWLDGLNIPFFSLNPIDFLEVYEDHFGTVTHESRVVSDEECTDMKFPWKVTKMQLDSSDLDHSVYEYRLPDMKQVNHIISACAERISPGKFSTQRQDTSNRIYQIFSGSGKAVVTTPRGEEIYELVFDTGDALAIPSWHKFTIHANNEQPLYLFTFSDKAMLENLNLFRSQG
jgi:gentisate 1,2-dioxygenase